MQARHHMGEDEEERQRQRTQQRQRSAHDSSSINSGSQQRQRQRRRRYRLSDRTAATGAVVEHWTMAHRRATERRGRRSTRRSAVLLPGPAARQQSATHRCGARPTTRLVVSAPLSVSAARPFVDAITRCRTIRRSEQRCSFCCIVCFYASFRRSLLPALLETRDSGQTVRTAVWRELVVS